jgi:hypothetical protein
MRKDQISVLRQAESDSVHSSFRWSTTIAGAFVALLVFVALVVLTLGLSTGYLNNAMLSPLKPVGLTSANKWLLFWIFLSGAIALFTGAFLAARSSGPVTTRVGRMEGLVISSLFFPLLVGLGFFASFGSPQYRTLLDSLDLVQINPAMHQDIESVINPKLRGLNLDRPSERVIEGLMKRILSKDAEAAHRYLAARSGISMREARGRIEPIRAQVEQGFTVANAHSAYFSRLFGLLAFSGILFGSLAAMAGGSIGAQLNLRAPLSKYDLQALEESVAA